MIKPEQPSSLSTLVSSCFLLMLTSVAAIFVYARGGIDFSLGGIEGLCIVLSGYIIVNDINHAWLALVVSIAVGGFIGLFTGVLQAALKVPAFIATLATSYILRGIINTALNGKSVTFPAPYASHYNFAVSFVVLLLAIGVCYYLFEFTRFGKISKCIGANENAVRFTGIDPKRYVILGHVVLGIFVGIGAFIITPRFSLLSASVGTGLELDVMIACMIGGLPVTGGMTAKISRPIIGSIIIAVLNQGYTLMGVESSIIQVTKGLLFILIIVVTTPGALTRFKKRVALLR